MSRRPLIPPQCLSGDDSALIKSHNIADAILFCMVALPTRFPPTYCFGYRNFSLEIFSLSEIRSVCSMTLHPNNTHSTCTGCNISTQGRTCKYLSHQPNIWLLKHLRPVRTSQLIFREKNSHNGLHIFLTNKSTATEKKTFVLFKTFFSKWGTAYVHRWQEIWAAIQWSKLHSFEC